MSYECDACDEQFDTLSAKRLHDCPQDAQYGGDAPDAEIPVADMSTDEMAELAVEQALICDVCAESNDGADDIDRSMNAEGIAITVIFDCSECGAHNENTATLQ